MAYTRHEWECGEVVTAEMLNNIEEGIEQALAGGGSVAPLILQHEIDNTDPQNSVYYISTSFGEIRTAYLSGRAVILDPVQMGKQYLSLLSLYDTAPGGKVVFLSSTGNGYDLYSANTDGDYPVLVQDSSN